MRKYKPEQMVTLLRQVEVGIANGKTTPQACKEAEITAETYYRWREVFGFLNWRVRRTSCSKSSSHVRNGDF
jgi:hypothetical protein